MKSLIEVTIASAGIIHRTSLDAKLNSRSNIILEELNSREKIENRSGITVCSHVSSIHELTYTMIVYIA